MSGLMALRERLRGEKSGDLVTVNTWRSYLSRARDRHFPLRHRARGGVHTRVTYRLCRQQGHREPSEKANHAVPQRRYSCERGAFLRPSTHYKIFTSALLLRLSYWPRSVPPRRRRCFLSLRLFFGASHPVLGARSC